MVILMVGLVILVVFIVKSTIDVTTEDRCKMYKSRGIWSYEILSISLSVDGFHELNLCIYASSFEDRSICFSDKKNSNTTKD